MSNLSVKNNNCVIKTTEMAQKYKSEPATAIIDNMAGTATIIEGAEVIKSGGVSFATPLIHQFLLPSSCSKSTMMVTSDHHSTLAPHNINKVHVISTSTATDKTVMADRRGQTVLMISSVLQGGSSDGADARKEDCSDLIVSSPSQMTQLRSDDELTSLTWLQNSNLLQATPLSHVKNSPSSMRIISEVSPSPKEYRSKMSKRVLETPQSQARTSEVESPTSDYTEESADSNETEITVSETSHITVTPDSEVYNPLVNITSKPPYSFSSLIFMAIEDSEEKALPVKDIYSWVINHFPFYMNAPNGWKNSVRHNLSLNKCFKKVDKIPNLGKGSLWKVDQQHRTSLMTALNKSICPPGSKTDHPYPTSGNPRKHIEHLDSFKKEENRRLESREISNERLQSKPKYSPPQKVHQNGGNKHLFTPNPTLFPRLAKHMEEVYTNSEKHTYSDDNPMETADAAAIMLNMKHGHVYDSKLSRAPRPTSQNGIRIPHKRKQFHQELVDPNNVFISTSPSVDHAYSSADNVKNVSPPRVKCGSKSSSPASGVDEAFSDTSFDSETESKGVMDGAEILWNLASIATSVSLRREVESNPLLDLHSLETFSHSTPSSESSKRNKRKVSVRESPSIKRSKMEGDSLAGASNNNNFIMVNQNRLPEQDFR